MFATVALMFFIFGMFVLLPCVLCLEVHLATAAKKVFAGMVVIMFTRRLSREMLAAVASMCIIFGMFALLPCVLSLEVTLATAAIKVLLGLFVVAMKRLCATVAMKLRCFIGMFAWAKCWEVRRVHLIVEHDVKVMQLFDQAGRYQSQTEQVPLPIRPSSSASASARCGRSIGWSSGWLPLQSLALTG